MEDALARGAATLVPRDQHAALASLARLVRDRSEAQVVAVVGSTGKTTTKDALAALCAAVTPTVAADASRNNEIGLPLTVLRLEPDTRVLVTEMGMRGAGQVAELCDIARPTLALVTSIGPEHLELVGTLEDVARANAEALEALPAGGIAVVPAGEPLLDPYLDRSDLDVRFFDPTSPTRDGDRWRFRVGGEELRLELPFTQRHLAGNVLAALTAYQALGLPLRRAHEGAGAIRLSRWRGEVHDLPGGGFVVNDAYNANPTSMRAALARSRRARRGPSPGGDPRPDGGARRGERPVPLAMSQRFSRELGIEVVVAVGEPARRYLAQIGDGVHVADTTGFDAIAEVLDPGDAILVKGSRSVGLEGIPALIQKHSRAWSES